MGIPKRPQLPEPEALQRLPAEQLVGLIDHLVSVIVQQQRVIEELTQEVNRLKVSVHLDSHTSSKPPLRICLRNPGSALKGRIE